MGIKILRNSVLFFVGTMIMSALFSSCIDWGHVIEHNDLRHDDIRVDAQRDLSNISFVVEKGKTYTKIIPQPQKDQLKFVNGYIRIRNKGPTQVQIILGDTLLYKMGDQGAFLNAGGNTSLGHYEIPLSYFSNTVPIDQLKTFSNSYVPFPAFTMERGKLCIYAFEFDGNTVSGPEIINVDPYK